MTKKTIPISICIPCFPRDTPKLFECLQSIEDQTILPSEVVIGHSEMNNSEKEKLKNELKYSFNVIISNTEKKAWAAGNRNRAGGAAKEKYISFFDADDKMFPYRLEVIWNVIEKYNPHVIIHGFSTSKNLFDKKLESIDQDNLMFGDEIYDIAKENQDRLWIVADMHHGHSTIHRLAFDKIKQNETEEFKRSEDSKYLRDLVNFYGREDKEKIIFTNIPLSYYIAAIYQSPPNTRP